MSDLKGPGTLLPSTAPDLVADLFKPFSDQLNGDILPLAIANTLTNPDICPLKWLPYLAFGLGMGYYPTDLDEAGQRRAVKEWWQDSKEVGTLAAVKKALERFGETYEVIEWFEDVPEADPQTFCVIIDVGATGIQGLKPLYMVDAVRRAKKLTAHLNKFRFVIRSNGLHYTGAAIRVGQTIKTKPVVIA